jgi:hypothetical protein
LRVPSQRCSNEEYECPDNAENQLAHFILP